MKRTAADSDRENRSVPERQRDGKRGSGASKTEDRSVASLHQSVGNQAVQRLHETGELQANPDVSDPNDRAEREARRVADRVMRMSDPTTEVDTQKRVPPNGVQRMCSRCQRRHEQGKPLNCKECEAELQRAQADGPTDETPNIVAGGSGDGRLQRMCADCTNRLERGEPLNCPECETELQRTPSSGEDSRETRGQPSDHSSRQSGNGSSAFEATKAGVGRRLDPTTRRSLEPRFGYDFGGVRIHTGRRPDELSRAINARAFTRGSDIYFARGEYRPNTPSGRNLLAHELTHTIQQGAVDPLGAGGRARAGSSTSVTRAGEDKAVHEPGPSPFPGEGAAAATNDLGSTVERPGAPIQRTAVRTPPDQETVREDETSRPTDEEKKEEEEEDDYGWKCSLAEKFGWFVPWSNLEPYTMQKLDRLPGPAEVYPSDPTTLDRGSIFEPAGAKCRGACGRDCSKCQREEVAGFRKTGNSVTRADYTSPDTWTYYGFYTCPTHDACIEHDACFDHAANEKGESGELDWLTGKHHMRCNLKCVCDYSFIQCVNFIRGKGGNDTMYFAEEVQPPPGKEKKTEEEKQPDGPTGPKGEDDRKRGAAGGCGACLDKFNQPNSLAGGIMAHNQVQSHLIRRFSGLDVEAEFMTSHPEKQAADLAIVENRGRPGRPTSVYLAEIKAMGGNNREQGKREIADYYEAFDKNPKYDTVFRLGSHNGGIGVPDVLERFDDRTNPGPRACIPQRIAAIKTAAGVIQYECLPPWSEIASSCDCEEGDDDLQEPTLLFTGDLPPVNPR